MIEVGKKYKVSNNEALVDFGINNGDILEVLETNTDGTGKVHAVEVKNNSKDEVIDSLSYPYFWCLFSHDMVYKHKDLVEVEVEEIKSMNTDLLLTLEERYNNWVVENIHVYELFCEFALKAIRSGKKKISHWLIVNRLRWEVEIETKGTCYQDKEFKISNDYIAFLARDFMKDYPEHGEVFKIKQMKRV